MKSLLTDSNMRWKERPIDRGGVLCQTVNEYANWVGHMLARYDEVPFGFTEWTVTGHLAAAACRLGYYVLQEYPIERRGSNSEAVKRPRPDLYVRGDTGQDYIFEVKQVYIKLGSSESDIEDVVTRPLAAARKKLYCYWGQARYRCSLLVAPIYADANDRDDRYRTRNSYLQANEKLGHDLCALLKKLPAPIMNYCGGFRCTYNEAGNEYQKGRPNGRRKAWDPIVGFVFAGKVIPPGHRVKHHASSV
jgi:hypothetical protein